LPAGAECGFNPSTLTPSGSAVSTRIKVEVQATPDAVAHAASSRFAPPSMRLLLQSGGTRSLASSLAIFAFVGMIGLVGLAQKQKLFARTLATFAIVAAMFVTASCAGYIGQKPPTPPNSTSYTVTVTATATQAPTHMQNFTLTVTQ
jgi:hypothetical protein